MFFIRTKNQEAIVEADTLQEAFVIFVQQTPFELLGMILIGHNEYFPQDSIPGGAKATRTTIPLVKANIISEEEAKDINEKFMGVRIV